MILSANPAVTVYRVEVSGWDNNKAFFVENSELEWSEESGKQVTLRRTLSDGAVVFLRLLQPMSTAAHEHRSPEPCGLPGRTGFLHGARPPAIPSAPNFLSAKPAHGILKQVSVPQGTRAAAKVQKWNSAPQWDDFWSQAAATCVRQFRDLLSRVLKNLGLGNP